MAEVSWGFDVKRRESEAWKDIGYTVPDLPALNSQAQLARAQDRAEHRKRKADAEAREQLRNQMVPPDRSAVFSSMHETIEAAAKAAAGGKR